MSKAKPKGGETPPILKKEVLEESTEIEKEKDMIGEVISSAGVKTARKRSSAEEIEKMRKDDNKLVKGIFRCHEPKGGSVTLVWREYKGDPIRRYTLVDGEQYEIPKGLAKHLTKNCTYYEHMHILGADGKPLVNRQGKPVSRMTFESMEFYE